MDVPKTCFLIMEVAKNLLAFNVAYIKMQKLNMEYEKSEVIVEVECHRINPRRSSTGSVCFPLQRASLFFGLA